MSRYAFTIFALLISVQNASSTCGIPFFESVAVSERKTDMPTIVLSKLEVSESAFQIQYKIKNQSGHDIWLCDWASFYGGSQFQVYLGEDGQTLFIQRRLDVLPEYNYR
jgi:hypothetical protein